MSTTLNDDGTREGGMSAAKTKAARSNAKRPRPGAIDLEAIDLDALRGELQKLLAISPSNSFAADNIKTIIARYCPKKEPVMVARVKKGLNLCLICDDGYERRDDGDYVEWWTK